MTRRTVLRPGVPADLEAIIAYLEKTSVAVADRFMDAVFAALARLAEAPGIGSPKHFARSRIVGVRSWAVPGFPNHLIYYKVHPDAIVVLAVLHGAQDYESWLFDER